MMNQTFENGEMVGNQHLHPLEKLVVLGFDWVFLVIFFTDSIPWDSSPFVQPPFKEEDFGLPFF